MVRFSGIKFATGLAYETHNPLPSHEIRRKRIREGKFSLRMVVYLRIADKYLGPLASRLSGVNQPGIST